MQYILGPSVGSLAAAGFLDVGMLSGGRKVSPPGHATTVEVNDRHQVGSVHMHSWRSLFQVLAQW